MVADAIVINISCGTGSYMYAQTDGHSYSQLFMALLVLIVILTIVIITHLVVQPSAFKTPVDTFPDRSMVFLISLIRLFIGVDNLKTAGL